MNLKIIIYIILAITLVSTICICLTKPTMHKSVLVYDSGYKIAPQTVETYEEIEMPVMTQSLDTKPQELTANEKIDNQITEQQSKIIDFIDSDKRAVTVTNEIQKTSSAPVTSVTKPKTTTKKTETSTLSKSITPDTKPQTSSTTYNYAPAPKTTTTNGRNLETTAYSNNITSAPIGNSTKATASNSTSNKTVNSVPKPIILTAQEEEIAWNKWRSNLQNKIMQDTKTRLPNVPNGTIFTFKFTVDKYGKITNLNTSSTSAQYVPYAIQYIAPVIRSYQGHSILNFPIGSTRAITDVSGSWRVSTTAKYSTQHDYNDIEKINK